MWRSSGPAREIALIGPAVTVALKAQGLFFSHWGLYLIVAGILIRNTRSPEAAESFLTTEHSLAVPELQSWHVQNRKIPKNKWLMERLAVVFVLDSYQ